MSGVAIRRGVVKGSSRRRKVVSAAPGHYPERVEGASLLFCGHNPSLSAWRSLVPFAGRSNLFWKLFEDAFGGLAGVEREEEESGGRAPSASAVDAMLVDRRIGFTDVLLGEPGNDASKHDVAGAKMDFFARLQAAGPGLRVVGFAGKRQWQELFEPKLKRCELGPTQLRPPGWPLAEGVAVHILASPSGRAAMKWEARLAPYKLCAKAFAAVSQPAGEDAGK